MERPELLLCDLHLFAKFLNEGSIKMTPSEDKRCDDLFHNLALYLEATLSPAWEYMEALVP